jgi:TRAP-type C4-dicarboxylate transport system substrate-binding protein
MNLLMSVFAIFGFFYSLEAYSLPAGAKLELKWIFEHRPEKYFQRAADVMQESLRDQLGDQIIISTSLVTDGSRSDRLELRRRYIELLKTNQLGIGQIYLDPIASKDDLFKVLDMPFLFRSHEHVTKFAEGPAGKKLLDRMAAAGLKGLALTYSGGYQGFLSGGKVDFMVPKPFEGKVGGSVSAENAQILGASLPGDKLRSLWDSNEKPKFLLITPGTLDFSLVTYADMDVVYEKHRGPNQLQLYNTDFNVLFTALVMNKEFYDSLPENYQLAIQRAATAAARAERELIAFDSASTREKIEKGTLSNPHISYVKLSSEEESALRKIAASSKDSISKEQQDLVKTIKNIR